MSQARNLGHPDRMHRLEGACGALFDGTKLLSAWAVELTLSP